MQSETPAVSIYNQANFQVSPRRIEAMQEMTRRFKNRMLLKGEKRMAEIKKMMQELANEYKVLEDQAVILQMIGNNTPSISHLSINQNLLERFDQECNPNEQRLIQDRDEEEEVSYQISESSSQNNVDHQINNK